MKAIALSLEKFKPLKNTFIKELVTAVVGSALVVAGAQIAIPLFFTPVPLSLQTLAVIMLGLFLGKRSVLALSLYIFEGLCGLPVFAGGSCGMAVLLGPSGGYIWLYPLFGFMIGVFTNRIQKLTKLKIFSALSLLTVSHLLLGSLWLATFVGLQSALKMGFLPFIIGDHLKVFFATLFYFARRKQVSQK